ncbi:MAG: NAD(P)H-dependent oxidoreductase [Proteobacteria bacterium]|nr:NAD(P)H-dependent oxidoreductase [Pseudomonadota bacterium]
MVRILIIYHSQSGHTRAMAEAVAAGAGAVEGAAVDLKQVGDAGLEDLLTCDGLAVGSPEYFGYMAGQVKDFFDRTYEPARGRKEIFKKPYVVFVSAGNDGRGTVQGIERIALGYPLKKVYEPVVARGEIDEDILSRCRELGQTLAAGCEAGIY